MDSYDIFISYSRKDTIVADKICAALDKAGITYFIDRQGIAGGMEFPKVLAEAIINSKLILFLASKNSYDSKYTSKEITFGYNRKPPITILPYIIDNSSLPYSLQFVFSDINWRTIESHPIEPVLVNDLLALLGRQTNTVTSKDFKNSVDFFQQKPNQPVSVSESGYVEVHFETNLACKVLRFNKEIATLTPDDDNLVYLKRGTHKLSFVSLENEADQFTQTYTISNDCELYKIDLATIQDTRLAREAEQKRWEEECRRIAKDDAKYKLFASNKKNLFRNKVKTQFGFKKDNKIVVDPKYDSAGSFYEGLARVELNGKYGFIAKTGKEIIPLIYDYVEPFWAGFCKVKLNGEYFKIDKTGKRVD